MSTMTYNYDGHAPCEVLHTWADGFGIWHVTLETEGVRATIPPAAEARDAIVAELADRGSPAFDPASIDVRLKEVMPTDRGIQWVYAEGGGMTRYICEMLHVGTDRSYCHVCGEQFPAELDDAKRAEVEATLAKRVGEVARVLATLPSGQALAGSPWLIGWVGADEHSPSGVWVDRTPGGWIVDGWVCAGWWDGDDYHEDQIVTERVVVGVLG